MLWIKKHRLLLGVITGLVLLLFIYLKLNPKTNQSLSPPLQKGSIMESVYGIGLVTTMKSYQYKPGVVMNVTHLYVKEGDIVKQGQNILDLDNVRLVAPFDGTVNQLPFKEGENVFAQAVVYSLVDLTDRYIVVSLEQRGALRVRSGQKAKISFDSLRDQSYEGVVESVYSANNNFYVRIGINSLPPEILPGMTGDVAIGIAEHQNVLLAPMTAIHEGKVSVISKIGKPREVEIKTGIVDDEMAEILSGDVHEGDRLYLNAKDGK